MRSRNLCLAGLLGFLSIAAEASLNPVVEMIRAELLGKVDVLAKEHSSTADMVAKNAKRIEEDRQKLDRYIVEALKYSEGKADLTKAVKEFYAAASAYLSGPTSILLADLDAKEEALFLEVKRAGID